MKKSANSIRSTRLTASCSAVFAVIAVCGSLVHPSGQVKRIHSQEQMLSGASMEAATQSIIARACRNCHSEDTEWPWYGYVAPISWMIEADVQRARSNLNLSHWQTYPVDQQISLLDEIETMTKSRLMPLPRYRLLHPEARLSDADIERLAAWTRAERVRLRSIQATGADRGN